MDRSHTNTMTDQITALVLSGGRGERFGCVDKGLVQWRGKALVAHVIDRLKPHVSQLLISCNRNQERYRHLGDAIITDIDTGHLGPLAGLKAAVAVIEHPFCLVCPNDTPLLPTDLVPTLLDCLYRDNALAAYPVCGQRHHFLPALVRSEALQRVPDYLDKGGRSLHGWYQSLEVVSTVDYSAHAEQFINVNTPAELEALSDAGESTE